MKTVLVITIAAVFAAIGDALLSCGMKHLGRVTWTGPWGLVQWGLGVFRSPYILLAIASLGVFFFLYLAALSWADLSFVLPLTSMSFIFAAFLARFVMHEEVSWLRWTGTAIIVLGIALVSAEAKEVGATGNGASAPSSPAAHAETGRGSAPAEATDALPAAQRATSRD